MMRSFCTSTSPAPLSLTTCSLLMCWICITMPWLVHVPRIGIKPTPVLASLILGMLFNPSGSWQMNPFAFHVFAFLVLHGAVTNPRVVETTLGVTALIIKFAQTICNEFFTLLRVFKLATFYLACLVFVLWANFISTGKLRRKSKSL